MSEISTEYAIDTHDLTKVFKSVGGGRITAVDHINLRVKRGELFGLVGPDGAGKTTTIRMLCSIMDPTEGTATVVGHDVVQKPEEIKKRIGYMSQRFNLYVDLTVAENIRLFADLFGVSRQERDERLPRLLEFSRLGPFQDRRAGQLSGGMKQKLALSCTLIHEPLLLLLDEPTTGVDPVSRREFWKILYELLSEGVTIFVSTSYMDEAERCNRVAFLYEGQVLAVGTPDELKALMKTQMMELKGTPRGRTQKIVRGLDYVRDVQIFGDLLHLGVDDAEAAMPLLRQALESQGVEIAMLRPIAPSMEDVFMELSGGGRVGRSEGNTE
ncbi:MAG: ABC transporter ATP-binding protein [Chloroflexi bacterium]|nr:ABC transporter ATP-binding protein [Chloroflexota bacterium]